MAAKYPAKNDENQHNQRFSDIDQEPCEMLMPIQGYEDQPLVSLEQAIQPIISLVHGIERMTFVAKAKCKKNADNNLSIDESASIILYSMDWEPSEKCLYHVLNKTLRTENRKNLKSWFLYLKLILTALSRLPSSHRFVFRGIKRDLRREYPQGETVYWWGFSSCTTNVGVLKNDEFLGTSGVRTMFAIECFSGKDIRQHSNFEGEAEILLPPGRQFEVVSCLDQGNNLYMIQLKEIQPAFPLLEPVLPEYHLKSCTPKQATNILLLGPTGVGKTTFINAFVNYLVYNTLDEAIEGPLQAIIPAWFTFLDRDTFEQKTIVIGTPNESEKKSSVGHSCIRECRSFVFSIGDRLLRLIDTPPVGDTRGCEQDIRNFHEIITYIAQFEYLNGICILLKPNEERLNILFRFCMKELLRHLHVHARQNIMFVFTNARATYFQPGSSAPIFRELLKTCKDKSSIEVPFSRDNSFLFDNEAFRFLALCKNGVEQGSNEKEDYSKSWNHSVREFPRLIAHITTCPAHIVHDTVLLHEVQTFITILGHLTFQVSQYIEQAIQLAQEYKKNISRSPLTSTQRISENDVQILFLDHPQLVCTNSKCTTLININGVQMIEYKSICYDQCYLTGSAIGDKNQQSIRTCMVMNQEKGICTKCDCSWNEHMIIVYKYRKIPTALDSSEKLYKKNNKTSRLDQIDKYISDRLDEQTKIGDVYRKVCKFLQINAILPFNDDSAEYIGHFIREEKMKHKSDQNDDIIKDLEMLRSKYENEINLLKKTFENERSSVIKTDLIEAKDICPLMSTLYDLPINGQEIRKQVEEFKINQNKIEGREILVELPTKANASKLMIQLKDYLSKF